MKAGSFAKWSGKDEAGRAFCYVGKVVSAKGGMIELETVDGVMGFSTTDGTVEKARKPARFDEIVAARNERVAKASARKPRKKAAAKATARKPRASKGSATKQDQVNALVKEHVEKFGAMPSRKDAIAHIVELGITTAAGASTMFANAKRSMG